MNKPILMLCDKEEDYALGLMKYLCSKGDMPFEVHTFTNIRHAGNFLDKTTPNCLIMTPDFLGSDRYECALKDKELSKFLLMQEKEEVENKAEEREGFKKIYKYQSAESIWKEVLSSCLHEEVADYFPKRTKNAPMKIIGIYTPIHKCLQTTFAVTLGQILARNQDVLYLNFEFYSGFSRLLNQEFQSDLSDLVYFFSCVREKFSVKLSSITEQLGDMDYIPPATSYLALKKIPKSLWIELFREIEKFSNYEFLILDLTEALDGVFDILRQCDYVYTICKEDPASEVKIKQYEEVIMQLEYEDVRAKTRKIHFPVFKKLPIDPREFELGDLAEYIKENILEEFNEALG